MKNSRTVVMALILVGLLSVPVRAQVIPGRWEKVEALTLGPRITVELKNGARLEGQFEELSPSGILLRTGSAQAAVPRADIERITTRGGDGLLSGALIGAGVGVGIVVGVLHPMSESSVSGNTVLGTAIMAGIGALIGVGVDALKKTDVVLYQAP